jgi:hypothetical protein
MAKLIGTDPNQVPTNGDLGTMAYQDYDVVAPQLLAGRRNLIINGAMQVAQRGTSVTDQTTGGYKTCDRFEVVINSFGTYTVEQSTDAPSDFKNSLKVTCTTAETSPSSSDYLFIQHSIEGQNLSHINFGSSDARQMTLSFWVKSNKTGTIGQEFQTSGSFERTVDVTINAADTWEYKTVLVPANAANTIVETNGAGLYCYFWLNSGGNFKGTPVSTWGSGNAGRAGTLTANIGGAVNDYFAITGVQLEVGSVATPFEHRSYGEELALCQRYYQKYPGTIQWAAHRGLDSAYDGHIKIATFTYPTPMRAQPSIGGTRYGWLANTNNWTQGNSAFGLTDISEIKFSLNGSWAWTGDGNETNNTTSVKVENLTLDAEL